MGSRPRCELCLCGGDTDPRSTTNIVRPPYLIGLKATSLTHRSRFTGPGSGVTTCVVFAISSTDPSNASFSIREVATFPLMVISSSRWPLIIGHVYEDHALVLIRCPESSTHGIIWNTKLNAIGQLRFIMKEPDVRQKVSSVQSIQGL